ncbi:MAG: hypothetical protein WC533_00600 [Candidatus Pacearchaeota archaeon]
MDLFENTILCKNCNVKMQKIKFEKNGFCFRAVECSKCHNKIIHPEDQQEYEHFLRLRHKRFNVKLRIVGNSYTVSIPKEIVHFINEQNKVMDEMVRLSFERMGKLSLMFNEEEEQVEKND